MTCDTPSSTNSSTKKDRTMPTKLLLIMWHWFLPITILVGIYSWQTRDLLPTGQTVTSLKLPTLAGYPSELVTQGKPTLLYFFAPWCQICGISIGNLEILNDKTYDIKLVAMDYETENAVHDFVAKHHINAPVFFGNEQIKHYFEINAYPTYYVLNNQAKVVASDRGYSTSIGLWIRTTNYLK